MGNLTTALIIVLMINAFMVMSQFAIDSINPGGATHFFTPAGSPLYAYELNGTVNGNGSSSNLPDNSRSVDITTGASFTDTWTTIKNWIVGGGSIVLSVLTGPYLFLSALHLDAGFTLIVGLLWYGITLFLVINWIKGGGGD